MRRAAAVHCAVLCAVLCACLALPGAVASQEVFVREGSQGWGQRIAARLGLGTFGRSIAVIVAVGDYRNGWPPLEAPARDAERVREFLVEEAGFDRVYSFVDAAASHEGIRRLMLEELPALIGEDDRLLFYFSGHGTQRIHFGDRVKGYLPLQGSAREGWSSMIAMDDLERWWLASAHARQSLFILDACFSGLGLQSKDGELRRRTLDELRRRGHHIVTAGTADQESYASISRWGGSLFTTALLEGMRGYADTSTPDFPSDGVISLKELWEYVGKRIRSEAPPSSMTPQLSSFEFASLGEFFFVPPNDLPDRRSGVGRVESKRAAAGDRPEGGADATVPDRPPPERAPGEAGAGGPEAATIAVPNDDRTAALDPGAAGSPGPADGTRRGFRDCGVCPEMVVLPPGAFEMGSDFGPDAEKPQHRVEIAQAFAMGRTEVTTAEWHACVAENACATRSGAAGRDPVTAVTRDAAQDYAAWLSARTGETYRLPTEAEWEYAAKGGEDRRFPTGRVLLPGDASFGDVRDAPGAVASHAANPFGLHDLAGSVWEWVADCFAPYGPDVPSLRDPAEACHGTLRGGSWRSDGADLRSTNRFFFPHDDARADFGLRVVRELSQ